MKQTPYGSIRKIILASMILLPFMPFILSLGIGYYFFTTSLETNTILRMRRIVSDHRQMIESFLKERKADLEFIQHAYSYQDLKKTDKLSEVFNFLQKESNAFVDLGIFNAAGVHERYHGPFELTGKIYSQTDWFKEVMKRGYYISDIFLGYRQIPHFVIAVVREEGEQKWVIRATIDPLLFNELVEKVRMGKTGEAYILNAKGFFQTKRRSGGQLMEKCSDKLLYPASPSEIQTFIEKDELGKKYLFATSWLKENNWLLVVRQEKSDAFQALHSAAYLIILISIVGGAVISSIAFYLTNHIVNRLEKVDAEKDQLNQQLIRASRLAELGEMSAGFAHEINNPLQIIKNEHSLITMILAELKENGELKVSNSLTELEDSIDQINLQIQRCAKITQAILKFGRKSEPAVENIDLNRYIPELTEIITKKASVHGISIQQIISTVTPHVNVDPAQLQQVLINVFNNAIDAIIEKHGAKGGELKIETRIGENGMVEIMINDNGCGISPENLKKIFSPFFTTKPVGKGTGLGLSVCYGIINSMGGTMEVESKEGTGTTFFVRLPSIPY